MEVIAERKKSAAKIFIGCIIAGVFSCLFSVFILVMYLIGQTEIDAVYAGVPMFLVVGVAFLVTGIVMERKMRRLPQRIVLEGNLLDFGNGLVCTADKIENVTYHEYKSKSMHSFSYGRLTVYVNGETLIYEFVADVERAHNRLIELMLKAAKK